MRRINIYIFLIVLILSLGLAGCGSEPANEAPAEVETPGLEDEVVAEDPLEVEEDKAEDISKDSNNPFAGISNLNDYYYEMETQVGSDLIVTSKIWVSGMNSRFESKSPESDDIAIIITNEDEGVSYIYTPSQNMALKMPFDKEEITGDLDSDENIDFIENFKMLSDDENISVSEGTFEGEPVQIISGDIKEDNSIIWISKKTGFPVKSEYYEDGKLEAVTLFKNFNNTNIDPSMFKIPDGVNIMDMTGQP